jgi:hypothetical protein
MCHGVRTTGGEYALSEDHSESLVKRAHEVTRVPASLPVCLPACLPVCLPNQVANAVVVHLEMLEKQAIGRVQANFELAFSPRCVCDFQPCAC